MSDPVHTVATRAVTLEGGARARRVRPYVLRVGDETLAVSSLGYRVGSRPGADLVLDDPEVSRLHFEILMDEHGYRLRDLGSTNGTVVDGARANDVYLRPGSRVVIGGTTLVFEPRGEEVDVPASPAASFGPLVGASVAVC